MERSFNNDWSSPVVSLTALVLFLSFHLAANHQEVVAMDSHGNAQHLLDRYKRTVSLDQNRLNSNSTETSRHRSKRTVPRVQNRFYRYGIVPYTFHRGVNSIDRHMYRQTMERFHHKSCVRFVPRISRDGQWARDLYRLGHGGYIEFVPTNTCSSSLGNTNRKTTVSCCAQDDCLHQLGHALGLLHEYQKPNRDGFIRVNANVIPQAEKLRYMKLPPSDVIGDFPFDISSPMGGDYKSSHSAEITLLTPDINKYYKKDFYMFRDVAAAYRCGEVNCSHVIEECHNDGYLTMVRNECQCKCPAGLDVETNCRTTISQGESVHRRCGGMYNLDVTENPTVTFSKTASQTHDCTWLINAPKDTTIVLDFEPFNIPEYFRECSEYVEVRQSLPGQDGHIYCGLKPPKTIQSYFNRMLVTYLPGRTPIPATYFTATARLVYDQTLCYNQADKGFTYDGTVNYTRDFSPCVNWSSVPHCPHNPYNLDTLASPLVRNYCRNPGNGIKPWCYVRVENCQRKYCDVCKLDNPVDERQDCASSYRNNCTFNVEESRQNCAKTCENYIFPSQIVNVANRTCPPPTAMQDSDQIDKLDRSRFAVGEVVIFRCRHANRLFRTELKKHCLSSGNWSSGETACLPCDPKKGQVLHGVYCYVVLRESRTANQQQARCARMGGQLADVRSLPEQEFITGQAFAHGVAQVYIGPNDMYRENFFRYRDFSPVTWTHWAEGGPANGPSEDCVWSGLDHRWDVIVCNRRMPAVCKIPMLRHRRLVGSYCRDAREDCPQMLEEDSGMCWRSAGAFAIFQCPLTCGRCL